MILSPSIVRLERGAQSLGRGVKLPKDLCPAMEFERGRFWCGMVRRPGHYLGLPS